MYLAELYERSVQPNGHTKLTKVQDSKLSDKQALNLKKASRKIGYVFLYSAKNTYDQWYTVYERVGLNLFGQEVTFRLVFTNEKEH